jgi:hypothetical protein
MRNYSSQTPGGHMFGELAVSAFVIHGSKLEILHIHLYWREMIAWESEFRGARLKWKRQGTYHVRRELTALILLKSARAAYPCQEVTFRTKIGTCGGRAVEDTKASGIHIIPPASHFVPRELQWLSNRDPFRGQSFISPQHFNLIKVCVTVLVLFAHHLLI